MPESIEFDDVVDARIAGSSVVLETPTLVSPSFSRLVGGDIWLKAENLQRTGSFKIRGAMNALHRLVGPLRFSPAAISTCLYSTGL